MMLRRIAIAIATCFGGGYAPLAPGTVGAAVGILPVLLLARWPLLYGLSAVFLFLTGVWASGVTEEAFGEHDSHRIVIDEAVSTMFTFAGLALTPTTLILGFILNRLLDIVKPYPAGGVQNARGGWGIMLDDLVAGIYSNFLLRIIVYFILARAAE